MPPEENNRAAERFSPAPLGRRIGAQLIDSGLGWLVIHLSTLPIQSAYNRGFGDLYLAMCQSFIIGWAVCKDAWWPGQSLGKRVARISIASASTGERTTRYHAIGRQVIFIGLLVAINVAAYVYVFAASPTIISQAIFASMISAAAPIRVLAVFLPVSGPLDAGNPQLLVLGFLVAEALLVYRHAGRRRIVDLLARTAVADQSSR